MPTARPRHDEVLSHYQKIASEYNARANQTCERAYRRLVGRFMKGRPRLLELGGGGSDLLGSLAATTTVACDPSREMLLTRPSHDRSQRVVTVGERLPFADARFDGVFSINVLEHVSDLGQVLAESSRVLAEGGLWLAVTPNGNWEALLDLAERWSLKIPEGPHQFLKTDQLRTEVGRHLDVLGHETMLVFPAGPSRLSSLVDAVCPRGLWNWGFFQYIVARKRAGGTTA